MCNLVPTGKCHSSRYPAEADILTEITTENNQCRRSTSCTGYLTVVLLPILCQSLNEHTCEADKSTVFVGKQFSQYQTV